jgi:hypothetical protein
LIVNSMFEKPGSVTGVPTNVNVTSGFVSASGKTGVALARSNRSFPCATPCSLIGESGCIVLNKVVDSKIAGPVAAGQGLHS